MINTRYVHLFDDQHSVGPSIRSVGPSIHSVGPSIHSVCLSIHSVGPSIRYPEDGFGRPDAPARQEVRDQCREPSPEPRLRDVLQPD
jgi:hypothetical protein